MKLVNDTIIVKDNCFKLGINFEDLYNLLANYIISFSRDKKDTYLTIIDDFYSLFGICKFRFIDDKLDNILIKTDWLKYNEQFNLDEKSLSLVDKTKYIKETVNNQLTLNLENVVNTSILDAYKSDSLSILGIVYGYFENYDISICFDT